MSYTLICKKQNYDPPLSFLAIHSGDKIVYFRLITENYLLKITI